MRKLFESDTLSNVNPSSLQIKDHIEMGGVCGVGLGRWWNLRKKITKVLMSTVLIRNQGCTARSDSCLAGSLKFDLSELNDSCEFGTSVVEKELFAGKLCACI